MKKLSNIFKINSLRYQLLVRFFLILILFLIIIEMLQYITMKEYLYGGKEQVLDARFHNLDQYKAQKIQSAEELLKKSSTLLDATVDSNMSGAIIDIDGNVISGISKGASNRDSKDITRSENVDRSPKVTVLKLSQDYYRGLFSQRGNLEGYKLFYDENNNLQIVAFRKIGDLHSPSGLIQLSISAKPVQDILYKQFYIYITVASVVLILGGIFAVTVFKYTLRPLYNMTNTIEDISVGQLNTRLPVNNKQSEINKLSAAFNNMLEKIELSFRQEQQLKEQMRQFISDASHELRTPLTSIHGFVEVLLRGAAKNEQQLELALNSILTESERLNKLVNDLLLLTRLDRHPSVEMKKENISDIINEIYPQFKILSKGRSIQVNLVKNTLIYANRDQVKQILYNLIQNAINHTNEDNGVINISTEYDDDFVVLKIKDNGIGISRENLEKIFDRFFRNDSHRARKCGGYGLGLSIVKSIVDGHNGRIEVNSEVGVGTEFCIYLKKYIET